jgi:hypothetical protein
VPVVSAWPSHFQGAEKVEILQDEDVTAKAMKLFRVLKNPTLKSV